MTPQPALVAERIELPKGEAPPDGINLVERRAQEVEAELQEKFSTPDSQQEFKLAEVADLLHTSTSTLLMATHDLGLTRKLQPREVRKYASRPQPTCTQSQVLDLNRHPYVRTTYVVDLAKQLNVSTRNITEVAEHYNIKPVVTRNPDRKGKFEYHGYFDLDQVALLESKVKPPLASADHKLQTDFVELSGIPAARVGQILETLGAEAVLLTSPETGYLDYYLTAEHVAQVLRYEWASRPGSSQ